MPEAPFTWADLDRATQRVRERVAVIQSGANADATLVAQVLAG